MRITSNILVLILILSIAPMTQASVIKFDDAWGNDGYSLVRQDNSGVEVTYSINQMAIDDIDIDGQAMKTISIPGVILPNNAGAPNLPGQGQMIAVPMGARISYTLIASESETIENIDIAPAPAIPFENDNSPPDFTRDSRIYSRNANYPESPVNISKVSKIRGVDYVTLGITPFQYNPVTKDLTVYKNLRVRIDFIGGYGQFGETRYRSRYWEPVLKANLINYSSLPYVDFNSVPSSPTLSEEDLEYIIIVPNDNDFIAWADTIKAWRNLQGIKTGVVTLSEIGGNSSSAIENYINNAYNNWNVPPSAVLLLSDYQNSGDAYGITSPMWSGYCVSDNIYADVDSDNLPDIAFARITAKSDYNLNVMVNKFLDYERNPPTDPYFYDHPITAGGWQTERWFILCTEICWGFMNNVLGKDPVREYAIYSGYPGSTWSTNTNTYMLLNYFGPDGLGYIPSTPEHLNDWGANATRVNNDINNGSFLMLHRDHGGVTGWGEPDYDIYDLQGLNNEDLPFVLSINCLTGKYNYGGTCFTEEFHRMQDGALGLIAASEVSYSFVNDTYIFGLFDYMWPDFDPGNGSPGEPELNPCFANASAKYYLQASSWPYNPQHKVYTHHLFHHHGDAFNTIYSEVPQNLSVFHDPELEAGASTFTITANNDALIGLTVDGEIIGTGQGTGGAVDIPILPQFAGSTMIVTVTKPNYYRYEQAVPVSSAGNVIADFSGNPTSGCAALNVNFTDLSVGDINSWLWNFGDGGTSTLQNPAYQYDTAGVYTVSLTVTGSGGTDEETKADYITVNGGPTADFIADPVSGYAPLGVTFTDASTGNPTSWRWDFGNGAQSNLQHPQYTYQDPGNYTVKLTVTNACGSDSLVRVDYITVEEAPTIYCDDYNDGNASDWTVVSGDWSVVSGQYDGSISSGFAYTLCPVGIVGAGTISVDWTSLTDGNWKNGIVVFGWQDANNYRAIDCRDGSNDWYIREYIDGTRYTRASLDEIVNSNQQYALEVIIDPGGLVTFNVDGSQKLSYDFGNVADGQVGLCVEKAHSRFDNFCVDANLTPAPPVAAFVGIPTSGNVPLLVDFTCESTGEMTSWFYDFGDGGTSEEQNPTYVYENAGVYTVTFIVTGPGGADTLIKPDYITVIDTIRTYVGEVGQVVRDQSPGAWYNVGTINRYVNPVVVMRGVSFEGSDPSHLRVTNVQESDFEWQIEEWNYLDGSHVTEICPYMVMEAGAHTLEDGTLIEAGTSTVDDSWSTINFNQGFSSTPALITGVMSNNETDACITRTRNLDSGGFQIKVQEEENGDSHGNEVVGWIAIEQGSGINNGIPFLAGRTSNSVKHNWYTINLSPSFAETPIFLCHDDTYDGGNTCGTRFRNLGTSSVEVFIEEEQSRDTEMNHTTEVVSYLAWANPGTVYSDALLLLAGLGDDNLDKPESEPVIPLEYSVGQNYPNPFNPITNIRFGLPEGADVRVEIYNIMGQQIEVLLDDYREAGYHVVSWDASNYASGIYLYRFTAGKETFVKRMTLLK